MKSKQTHDQTLGLTVKAFKVITGDGRMDSPERGHLFMSLLESVGAFKGSTMDAPNLTTNTTLDDAIGESQLSEWPDETRIDAIGQNGNDGAVYLECITDEDQLDDWARWVAVDKDGEVWIYSHNPVLGPTGLWQPASHPDVRLKKINTIAPPTNYSECLWEIKK